MAKRPNPNLAKIHLNYTVEEVAILLSVHKNTVRTWIKEGLPTNDDKRPLLILGADLRQYLQSKKSATKHKCRPFELYCVRCRLPQLPAENMVDYVPHNDVKGQLIGLCPTCNGIINKFFTLVQLEAIKHLLDISFPKALKHINESNKPLLNSDFTQ